VALCRSCLNPRLGGIYRLCLQGRTIRERGTSVSRWLQKIRSSETSVQIRSTRRHIQEDGILHSHRREDLKSYISLNFALTYEFSCGLVIFIWRLFPSTNVRGPWELPNEQCGGAEHAECHLPFTPLFLLS
jgi:hypothetical protein